PWSFTTLPGTPATCTVTRDGVPVAGPQACLGGYSFNFAGQPDGVYVFAVRSVDSAGNVSSAASSAFVLDTTPPPAAAFTTTPRSPGLGSQPTWFFTGAPGTTSTCTLSRGGTTVFGPASCAGSVSYSLAGLPLGTYTLTVVSVDSAGNVGP